MRYFKFGYLLLIGLISFFTSCDYFKVDKLSRKDIMDSKLKKVRASELKNYPQIDSCDTPKNSKRCFESQLMHYLNSSLNGKESINYSEKDTLWLTIHVDKDGEMSLKPQEIEDEVLQKMIFKIDSTLQEKSPVKPAYVDGINVSCNFKLPIVINKD